ncbi:MAG TPA: DUF3078 domain-containing protein [Moheibacter sp.]|nr:DUF3078 domain-containing protein [Moheibacter sp.]
MIKKIGAFLLVFGFAISHAQEVDASGNLKVNSQQYVKTKSTNNRLQGWYISGNNSLQFNQAAFSNWMAGGENSYALNANIDYEINLTKGKNIWDNRIILAYGLLKNKNDDYRKSNDIIDFTSSYGYEFFNGFYFAASTNFKTQFSEGYDYDNKDEVTGKYKKLSNLMAPAYWSFGIGVDYKPSDNLQLNFHPFTSRFTFVLDKDLQTKGNYGLKDDGESHYYEFGAFIGARYKIELMEGIFYDNRIGIYSNYLNNPLNFDIAYQGILDMKVNKLISAQATVNLYYNENQIKRTQLKETLGVGLSYKFNNTAKLKMKEENLLPFPTVEEAEQALQKAKDNVEEANKKVEEAKKIVEEAKTKVAVEEAVDTIEEVIELLESSETAE